MARDLVIMKSSREFEAELCRQLERIRLGRNVTQQQLADQAGVSRGTIIRMEKGAGCTLNTFIRVLSALRLDTQLDALLPAAAVNPIDRMRNRSRERQRARPPKAAAMAAWAWADQHD